jgi:hypothetical protein
MDKVPRGKRHQALALLRERVGLPASYPLHEISATTGEGIRELLGTIMAGLSAPLARSTRDHG